MATSERGLRALARSQLALGVLFAITFVVAAFFARFRIPYRDDWDWIAWRLDGPLTLFRLFAPSNEHFVPVPRLILSVSLWLEHTRNGLPFAIALTALIGTAVLFVTEIRRHNWRSPFDRAIATGVALTLLFLAWQLQTVAEMAAMGYAIVETFVVGAIVCTLAATDDPVMRVGWFVAAALACLGAAMTLTNGMAVPIVVAVVVFLRRRQFGVPALFALMSVAGLAAYFWKMTASFAAGPPPPPASAGQMAAFFLSFFASFASFSSPLLGVVAGSLILGAGLVAIWPVIRRSSEASRLQYFAVGVILFGIVTALAATPGRAHHGPTQGSQSRYAAFMLPYWCATWLLLWDRVSRSTWPRARQAVAVLALLATLALLPLHVLTAIVWRAKSDNVSTAGLALQSGVEDDGWLRTLHPSPIVVSTTVAKLRAAGDPAWQLPVLNAPADEVRTLDACAFGFVALPLTRAGDYELRSSLETAGDRGFVLDGAGKVIGLARVAPLASGTEPSHRDVISAVLRDLRRKTTRQWLGFAHASPSAPVAVIIERKATLVCRAPVSGS